MAGTLIVSNLTTDTDNTFVVRSNTGTTLFIANTTGIDIANSIAATAITSDKILSVANTKITGLVTASQIANVANTQITGTLAVAQGGTGVSTSTGTGAVVLGTSPTLTTPALGTPSALVLTNATSLPKAALPTGSVLQVVSSLLSSSVSTSSTSYVTTGLTASITPTSASSKILVLVNSGRLDSDSTGNSIAVTLYKGASEIIAPGTNGFTSLNFNSSNPSGNMSLNYLDSPATTSSTTYTIYYKKNSGSGNVWFNNGGVCNITLMEIAA